ncbi:MAG: DUF4852 domain-containing protein [Pseudobdellovibrionaceae bacterium]|jgi:hypothetical protein|nr:DUF4852 domain-containing protein [Pseudobdellovibrionaceae bacterium]
MNKRVLNLKFVVTGLTAALLAAAIFIPHNGFAQNADETPPVVQSKQSQQDLLSTSKMVSDLSTENTKIVRKKETVRYVPATKENIVRLLYFFNIVELNDLSSIDAYIRSSECNLYAKYYFDEFEWRKIEMATIDYLKKYSSSFSNYVEIIQPVQIGRYDFDLNGFTLENNGELLNMKSIQISDAREMQNECGLNPEKDGRFSGTAVVNLRNPINIDFIRVNHQLAKEYLQFFEDRYGSLNGEKQVFFRYRIRLDRFLRYDPYSNAGQALIFEGKVLQIDIFADQEMFLPLFSQTYE